MHAWRRSGGLARLRLEADTRGSQPRARVWAAAISRVGAANGCGAQRTVPSSEGGLERRHTQRHLCQCEDEVGEGGSWADGSVGTRKRTSSSASDSTSTARPAASSRYSSTIAESPAPPVRWAHATLTFLRSARTDEQLAVRTRIVEATAPGLRCGRAGVWARARVHVWARACACGTCSPSISTSTL